LTVYLHPRILGGDGTPGVTEPHKPKTRQERNAHTVAKLREAGIDLPHDRGLNCVPTTEIAERAGSPRGALTRYFASKEDIAAAAIERQLKSSTAVLRRMAADIRRSGRSADGIVGAISRLMSGRSCRVAMEYMPEARHDEDFRSKVVPTVKESHEGLDPVWGGPAEQSGTDAGRALMPMNVTVCTIRGLIAQTTAEDGPGYFRTMLDFCKRQVARESGPARLRAADAGSGARR
jgi:AcrR family transcriptional regulator